ncbi:MAG: transposon-encoded TnpW family protein [Clostridium sp.]|nr:transposon-encoded TnpW family protein [Clostridium sp.]
MSEQNEIIEDVTIREAIDSIYDMLAELPKEKRLAFFEQISKPKELDFVKEFDGIYYVVCSHFDSNKAENMVDKVNRILNSEV